jgi:hypothetical protein
MMDKEWEDGDDSTVEGEAYVAGFDEGFALALGMVFDYTKGNGPINTDNAVEVMNLIASRRAI